MRKSLVFIYQVLIFIPVGIMATIATAVTVMVGCVAGNRRFWSCCPPCTWSKFLCRLALCNVKVEHRGVLEKGKSYVFVANHQGVFDIFLIYGYLGENIKWVQKQELRKIPFVGKASEIAGHVFVDQSSIKSMKETIIKTQQKLEEGASMAIFPEGARTFDGKMGRFKKGAFIIAKEMGLPVVPVTVNGPFDVMKIHTYLINPGKLELIIHQPVPTKGMADEDITELMNQCRDTVHSALWDKYK